MFHQVEASECVSSIAKRYGIRDWKRIWGLEENKELRDKRKDPNQLVPGDVIHLPPKLVKPKEGYASHRAHIIHLKPARTTVRLLLRGVNGKPLATKICKVAGEFIGITDERGFIEIPIEGDATEVKLEIWPDATDAKTIVRWRFEVGKLLPVLEETPDNGHAGALARLSNLGYFQRSDGEDRPGFAVELVAIRAFQRAEKLKVTGTFDQATQKRLKELADGSHD